MDRILLMEQKAMALGCRCRRDEPMARHTTFKIGGPADLLVTAETLSQLRGILAAGRELELPVQILGNGSNLLVSDKGIRGVVIQLAGDFMTVKKEGEYGNLLWCRRVTGFCLYFCPGQ